MTDLQECLINETESVNVWSEWKNTIVIGAVTIVGFIVVAIVLVKYIKFNNRKLVSIIPPTLG